MMHARPIKPLCGPPKPICEEAPAKNSRGEQTRQLLLDAAFHEIHLNGYRAASLSDILRASGCAKGSLYHHFPDKHALGIAAVSSHIDAYIEELWLAPLRDTRDPLRVIRQIIERYMNGEAGIDINIGCPLNNLCQEMSAIDENFRLYLDGVLSRWRDTIEAALKRGQKAGNVCADLDPTATAALIVAIHQGTAGTAKTARNREIAQRCGRAMFHYLDQLRP